MPLPETISAKYTEEEAGHLSIRPVVQQTFRAPELVDMVVQVAGKDLRRVQKVFPPAPSFSMRIDTGGMDLTLIRRRCR